MSQATRDHYAGRTYLRLVPDERILSWDNRKLGLIVSEHLRVADDDGVRTITIDRPEVKNALTKAMRDGLCELLAAAEHDDGVRVVVITGVDPVFTAGVDFKEVAQVGAAPANPPTAIANNPGRALRQPARSP